MLLDDFLRYIKVSTQSGENSNQTPSTKRQLDLLNLLKNELVSLGVECELDEFSRLYGYIPGNKNYDCVGLCAHVDTALECSGENVNPQVINNYDCGDIPLGKSGLILSPTQFSHLNELKGKTIITTDGTTLLGGDDKAGVAIIMDVIRHVLKIEESKRRPLAVLFTPDEEVGRGPEHFDAKKYGAKYAYTLDGASPYMISIENFNAKAVEVHIYGQSIHPGEGKDKLINAILLMNEFINLLPSDMIPYKTENREGFNHITDINGSVEECIAHFILRNHDANILDKQIKDFENAKYLLEKKYSKAKISLKFYDQYKNMYEIIQDNPVCKIEIERVYKKLNIPFEYEATRGGTDGATFSFLGCPCPNLGTGSYNHHGKYEYAVLEEMELLSKIVSEIYKI